MNRRNMFTIIALLFSFQAFPKIFILNEDFCGASGSTPPAGWNNIIVTGNQDDQWHFDNSFIFLIRVVVVQQQSKRTRVMLAYHIGLLLAGINYWNWAFIL